MTKNTSFYCDCCAEHLPKGFPAKQHFLSLRAEKAATKSDETFCVYVEPPIHEDQHFCDLKCLKMWIEGENW